MDINTLLDTIETTLANDTALRNWANVTYGRTQKVYINVDTRNMPAEGDCPYVAAYPASKSVGARTDRKSHRIEMVFCINDDTASIDAENNIVKYEGVARVEEFRKLAEDALAAMDIGNVMIDRIDIEYDTIDSFPFMVAAMSAEFGEQHLISSDPLD